MWLSQIRKVFGEQERDNLYLVTQKINRLDVALRDLAHWIIECEKVVRGKNVYIIRRYYQGIEHYEQRNYIRPAKLTYFKANQYFKYYDSYELVNFGESAYL